MASLSPLPDMTCILSCRIPGPRAETATKINRLSIYMYNPRESHKVLVFVKKSFIHLRSHLAGIGARVVIDAVSKHTELGR